jgi:hypothetical protein
MNHLFPELPGRPAHRVAGCVVVSERVTSGLRWQVGQKLRQFRGEGREVAVAEAAHAAGLPSVGDGPESAGWPRGSIPPPTMSTANPR